ncbi:tetratricopeptide repeat protein [Neptunomonas qingdaonensis]|uniref:Tetratricopeptide repeat-containing protein n=1 Tax=Neptunomonas qingdaonensis TaxID=1045558 RepID=A0A1I2V900_9GAMM|nr:tetratricopeptide repeat protein [Neptunomonas qingdaonensis]SFG85835.1 Tetratricopeptide repeat-containing protein [Neptunomonas qingdaonensis]
MSLVNDMLRDLDERKREGSTGYRAVAKRDSNTGHWIWIALLIALVTIVGFFVREWGGKINERSDFLSWLDKEQVQTASTSQPPLQESLALIAQQTDVQKEIAAPEPEPERKAKPEITAPVTTNISAINWTSQSDLRGTLTFWLDQVKPFVLYSRSTMTLDIAIEESLLAVGLPDISGSLLATIDIVPEEGKSRFKLVASDPVEFSPKLKQNPARLVVEVSRPAPVVSAVIPTRSADKETTAVLAAAKTSPPAQPTAAPRVAVSEDATEVSHTAANTTDQRAGQATGQKAGQWKKSLNTLPTDSSVVRSARRLLSQQRTDEALDLLKDYVNKAPASLQSRYLLVQLYLATERYAPASEILHTAPDNLSWGLLQARAFLQQGQAKHAIELLEQYPDGQSRQDYLDLLASGYQQAGQHAAAVARYLSLLTLNSQEGRWWINLGVSLEHLGQTRKALDAYRSALQIPDLEQSLKQYAQLQSQRLMQSQ